MEIFLLNSRSISNLRHHSTPFILHKNNKRSFPQFANMSTRCDKCGADVSPHSGKAYRGPSLTVDAAVFRNDGKELLMIKRGKCVTNCNMHITHSYILDR
jgi:hypothetical protein